MKTLQAVCNNVKQEQRDSSVTEQSELVQEILRESDPSQLSQSQTTVSNDQGNFILMTNCKGAEMFHQNVQFY